MKEYKSFFKTVEGNEGARCHYPTRLDTYGCGCSHNCAYCYARSLLSFRGLWGEPSMVDLRKVAKTIRTKLLPGDVVRLGGMTDCFQAAEAHNHTTLQTIRLLNHRRVHYLIVTKSPLVATDAYIAALDPELAHIQVSITSTDDEISRKIEPGAPIPDLRIAAVERLQALGFDVAVRLSPFFPPFVNLARIRSIKCDKLLVEFLRVNAFIAKLMQDYDLSAYSEKVGGYRHLPLNVKRERLASIDWQGQISVCEDVEAHQNYWVENVNANPDDCCNLRITKK